MRTLSLKLPPKLDAKLTLAAQRNHSTKSEVVRRALEAYLNNREQTQEESFLDLAEGLIGCVEGPEDLSQNPEYMKHFGE
jgi:predicted transcriptional regulator